MSLEGIASFLDKAFWPLLLAGTTLAAYVGARIAHVERNSPWRAFLAALAGVAGAFAAVVLISYGTGTLIRNPLYWIGIYAVTAALAIKSVLRAPFRKAVVPWLFSVLFFGTAFIVLHLARGAP